MRRIFTALLLSVLPAVALSERLSVSVNQPGLLNGIDEEGLISEDEELAGDANPLKISLNTKTGKVKESAKGQVTNQSGVTQTYKDPADFGGDPTPGQTVLKVLYKVKADGAAKFRASIVLESQEDIDNLAAGIRALGGH